MHPLLLEGFVPHSVVESWRKAVAGAKAVDGRKSAGRWARDVKRNKVLEGAAVEKCGTLLLDTMSGDPRVAAFALPYRLTLPNFLRYEAGDYYGRHEDNAVQSGLRADVSFTFFLSDPQDYDGGEFCLDEHREMVKPAAGALLLYQSGLRHEVKPLVTGQREVAVGWIQSLVRDPLRRSLLSSMASALEDLRTEQIVEERSTAILDLNRVQNELLRLWAET